MAFLIKYDGSRGRYLAANTDLSTGVVIIKEKPFSSVVITEKIEDKFICCHCYKEILTIPKHCIGCSKQVYCSTVCQLLSWKSHHWMECFMMSILMKMAKEVQLALRIILNAAHSVYEDGKINCSSLHKVGADMFHTDLKAKKFSWEQYNLNSIVGDYFNIYCLQRHENENAVTEDYSRVETDIKILTKLVLKIISIFHDINKEDIQPEICILNGKKIKHDNKSFLLHLLFRRLSFVSYYTNPHFDIRSWHTHVRNSCESADKMKGYFPDRSISEIFTQIPLNEEDLIERLLVHHYLQLRTNTQAIFRICGTTDSPTIQNTEQRRIASAVFSQTSLMNHSCSPNTSISFDGHIVKVVALKFIKGGEEICHCYGPHHKTHNVEERQQLLKKQYFFTCSCNSCILELEDNSEKASFKLQFQAFKCKYCSDPVKPEKGSGGTRGTCINEICRKRQDLIAYHISYQKFQADFQEASNMVNDGNIQNAKNKLLECLTEASLLLYHNHLDIGKIHDMIARCLVTESNYASALPHLRKSISIVGMLHGTQSIEMGHELQKLASLYFNMGNLKHAATNAQRVISIYETCCPGAESMQPGFEDMKQIVLLNN